MRKASTLLFGLVGLTSILLAQTARAQEVVPVAEGTAAPARERRLQIGVAFLPLAAGKFDFKAGGMDTSVDTAIVPGYSLSASYEVLHGLSVGVAPQAFFGVKAKDDQEGALDPSGNIITSKEYDLLARVAYAYPIVDTIRLYAEVLPGYSLIMPSFGHTSKGFVLAGGVGAAIDLGDTAFISLGGGYQIGFQQLPAIDKGAQSRTRFVRVALGVGVRF
jgi:hypothetical protein